MLTSPYVRSLGAAIKVYSHSRSGKTKKMRKTNGSLTRCAWNCIRSTQIQYILFCFITIFCCIPYRWFELRRGAEEFLGLPVVPNPCPKGGENAYIPMKLSDAKLPDDDVRCV